MLSLSLLLLGGQALLAESASAAPCDPPANAIVCENSKPGNPAAEWDVSGAGDPSIQGFATEISVDQGETVHFKVDTPSDHYHLDIYRMGYYGGDGARKVDTVQPGAGLPQEQPPCEEEESTGLVDCGNWAESASWAVPANAVSGIYFAKLVRDDEPLSEGSHIVFVVRDDDGHSDLLFQTSDTTWQAYNRYGGNSLYEGGPGTSPDRAYKVSYNRPLTTRGPTPEDDPFNAEYPMVRWLERNGYDVSYFTGVDADRRGGEMLEHRAYLSVGHDEYWSAQQRANVEAARAAGVNLAFFCGNEIFWKTRWEDSIDGSGSDHRTLVSYKETHANAKIDPEASVWTGTWRDPRFSPPADGGRPENALSGTIFTVNSGTAAIEVPAAEGKLRLWRKTSVASLAPGQTATLSADTLGYEWDEDLDNGFRPAGLMDLSSTTVPVPQRLLDYGSNYGPGNATHHLTLYRAASGALVFGAGTVQWSWGLDGNHDRGGSTPDPRMQQATVNLLADMGVQPGTLQGDLAPVAQTTDSTPPTSTISAPTANAQLENGHAFTIAGTATDTEGEVGAGGQVAGVEVSVDGGASWHPAGGRDSWTYSWTPGTVGKATIESRAVDDSGNLESATTEVEVDVVPANCPCSIWGDSLTAEEDSDSHSVEVGVKFRADVTGFVSKIRFYKTPGNVGPHVGRLWTADGDQLAEATFTGETASGWQEAGFASPVEVDANTTYVASYHAPSGHYASLADYFALVGTDNPPLHALADGVDGPNGIFRYGPSGALFSGSGPESFQAANYLVDVVFTRQAGVDTSPPTISKRTPADDAGGVRAKTAVTATFNEALNPATVSASTVQLRNPSNGLVPASVAYDAAGRQVKLTPQAPLQYSTTYTATIKGGPGGVSDVAGNALAADSSWHFTTVSSPPSPNEGPGGPILVISNGANPFSEYYAEILRAEGLNEFDDADISNVTPALLAAHDVAILGEGGLSAARAQLLSEWVEQGGHLIAMRPDSRLSGLLGLGGQAGTLSNGYLKVDTSSTPGAGIVADTMQFHGTADRYTVEDAQTVATLFSDAGTATPNPAVTLRSVGPNGGQAAAFSYDLARSIVYTRQGNPAWAGEERDGSPPIRSDDLFFGAKTGDMQPDWVNLNKVRIPQADEQQRLLTNLIEQMNADRKPLPRFWFLPRDEKAAVVMTGDDHAGGGTAGRFEQYEADSPPGCVVASWECVRSTSYIYPNTPLTNAEAAAFTAKGFEIAAHTTTDCDDWGNRAALEAVYTNGLEDLAARFPSIPTPSSNRMHCVVWSDWATQPKVERENDIRFDTSYYYWPESWVQDRPGMFTGSGMPMRFADTDGSMIDVYQAATQMTDESGQAYPFTVNELLDHALGSDGYYGVFTANMHTDEVESPGSSAIVAAAQARGVPIVSARQMLTWLDGRNQSSFDSIQRAGHELSFTIDPASGANGLRAMLPTTSGMGTLVSLARGGSPVSLTTRTIKGVEYAFFDAVAGSYTATYFDEADPVITNVQSTQGADGAVTVSWRTNELAGSRVDYGTAPGSLGASKGTGGLTSVHSVRLTGLETNRTYYFRVTSADGSGNSASEPSPPLAPGSFTTRPAPPLLSATLPASPVNENAPKVIGSAGEGTTVRLYTGSDCSAAPIATGSSAALAAGIGISVADNSTTTVRATATNGTGASACSEPLTYVEDSNAPQTQIDTHPNALTNSPNANFTFSGNDGSGFGVASYECRRDTGAWGPCTSPQSYTNLSDGSHSFEVKAIDQAGNVDPTPAAFNWQVDTKAPTVGIDSLSKSLLKAGESSQVSWHADENGSFELRVGGSDCDSGTVLDSGAYGSQPSAHASTVAAAQLQEGANTLRLCLTDAATNRGQATTTLSKDTGAPNTTIDTHPNALTNNPNASFAFSGNDGSGSGVASYECRRDSGAWSPCTSPQSYTNLSDGSHSFEVRAIDQAGNVDPTPAAFNWTVDTAPPAVHIDSGPTGLTNDSTPTFAFGSEPGAGFECSIDTGTPSFGPCSAAGSHTPSSPLTDGPHTFRVRATDQAANQATATRGFTVDATPPSTTIDTHPNALTNSPNANFAFSGNDGSGSGVASYECRRDSGAWGPCTSPQSYTNLSDGAHSFEARAIDQAGNTDPTPATFNWTVDTAPPAVHIDSGPTGLTNDSTPSFAFGSEPGAGFECSIDTGTPSYGPCSAAGSHTPSSPLTDGPHTFRVRATDQAANQATATRGFTVDATPPSTTIDTHPNALTNNPNASFAFSGNDGSGSGVASYECRRDSGAWSPCTSPQPYTNLSDGSHSFEARAIDQAGNTDPTPATFNWTVDTAPPAVHIDSGPTGLTNDSTPTFAFSSEPGAGFECSIDTGTPSYAPCSGANSHTPSSPLTDGPHTFRVRATDQAANQATATRGFTVDATPPSTTIDTHPNALTNSPNASFAFSGNDGSGSGIASYECRRDSGAWSPCTSPQPYTNLSDGAHSFEARAIDQAGNTDPTPATFNWTVDTAPPAVHIDSGPTGLTNDSTPTFAFGSEPGAGFECSIDTGTPSFGPCSAAGSHTPSSPLTDGPHTFRVRATDQAANQATATRGFTVDATPPSTTIDTHPNALTNSPNASFAFSGNDGSGSGVASYECRRDSGAWGPCTSPQSYTALSDGSHSFEVRAIDQAGNADPTPAAFNWQIDTAPPAVHIDSGPTGLTNDSTPSFAFGSEPGAGFECSIDTGTPSYAPCSGANSHTPSSPLTDGPHTFRVRATDQAANQATATRGFTVDATPPSTTIDTHPNALTNSPNASFAFSGNDGSGSGVASYECRRDSGAWSPCTSPQPYTALSDGSHSFEARAIDQAGNTDPTPATFNWTVDTAPPAVHIDSGPTGLTNDSTPSFAFGSEPGAGTECSIDTGTPSFGPCSAAGSHTPSAPLTDGPHTFRVRATDQAANQATATRGFTVDTAAPSAPELTATAPPSPANDNTVEVIGTAPAGSTVRLYSSADCSGSPIAAASTAQLEAGIATTVADNSTTAFTATATTAAENTSGCSEPLTYVEDSNAPQTQIDTHPNALTNSPNASFAFSGNDGSGSGIASYECRRDSGAWGSCTSPQSYTNLSDGAHSFEARAIDQAGNTDATPAAFNWQVDTKAPTVGIDSLSKSLLKAGESSQVSWHADENGSFELRVGGSDCDSGTVLDSGAYGSQPSAHASTVAAAQLQEGANTLRLCLTDAATNRGQATATLSKDTGAPNTTIDTHPNALTNSPNANFAFSGNDGSGSGVASYECRRDSGAWSPCTSPQPYTNLSDGSHSFEVRAIDQAGNTDPTPATFNWTVDTAPPAVHIDSGPTGLTNDSTPTFAFGSEPGAGFECSIDTGTPSYAPCSGANSHTPSSPLTDGPHTFRVRATDQAANQATATRSFTVDTSAPEPPTLTATVPASPAGDNSPELTGTAPVDSTVRLYASADCSGSPIATASAAQLEAGVEVTVADNSTTSFSATATTTAGNTSGCSDPISYVEDSNAPQTQIDTHPAAVSSSTTAGFEFSGSDVGSGLASFECRLDSEEEASWEPCASPQLYSSLPDGGHGFEVRATDLAGNADSSPAFFAWTVDTTVHVTPTGAGPSAGPGGSTRDPAQLIGVKRDAASGTAVLIFKVPGPGVLSARSRGPDLRRANAKSRAADLRALSLRGKRIKPKTVRVPRAGQAEVPIELAALGRRLLDEGRKLKVKVTIRFAPADGPATTWNIAIALTKEAPPEEAARTARQKRR